MMNMKKITLLLGLIASALCLTNCTQNDDYMAAEQTPNSSFELFAPTSRTTNDGVNTLWQDGDDITVFHAESGTIDFVNDKKFELVDASTGRFVGSLASELTAESYDWYVTYPHYGSFTKPGTGYYNTIGCTIAVGKQTQNGNNSSAHICGKNLPLIGVAKGVVAGETPSITLNHAASFAKFTITNKLNEPITITSVEMKAEGYHLVGQFYIKFAEEVVLYTPRTNNTMSTALLEVKDGEPIAAGESAIFYMAVAPFTLTESSPVSFKVTATNSSEAEYVCEKSVTPAAGWGFTAGKYKSVSFGFEALNATLKATTAEATDINTTTGTTATLNGSYVVTNSSGNESVTCGFEYKQLSADDYISVTAQSATTFTYALTDLVANSEYIYRAWASLDGGTTKSYGEEMRFTPTAVSVTLKSISLTTDDMANINEAWAYGDEDIKSFSTADGNTWTAYQAYRGKTSSTIGVKKDNPNGYLATPVLSGNITKIVINIKSNGAETKFTLSNGTDGDVFYTSDALGKTTQDWAVDITTECKQIAIRSASGTVTINSVKVYYE